VNAFDADVLIYAAREPAGPLGHRVLRLLLPAGGSDRPAGVGSLLLLPEVLSKAVRLGRGGEVGRLQLLLARLELRPLDGPTADLAVALGAAYLLRGADAVHLATAVNAGADRFVTNNQRDFPKSIGEIEIVYPEDLEAA